MFFNDRCTFFTTHKTSGTRENIARIIKMPIVANVLIMTRNAIHSLFKIVHSNSITICPPSHFPKTPDSSMITIIRATFLTENTLIKTLCCLKINKTGTLPKNQGI